MPIIYSPSGVARGIEALRATASHRDSAVSSWFSDTRRPQNHILGADYLRSAPANAITVLRQQAIIELSKNLRVEDPEKAMEDMARNKPRRIKLFNTEIKDSGLSVSHTIPIECDRGTIFVEANSAYGVSWWVSDDHPLSRFEGLTQPREEDWGLPHLKQLSYGEYYIAPNTFNHFSHVGDLTTLAKEITSFTGNLLLLPNLDIRKSTFTGAWDMGGRAIYGLNIGYDRGPERPYMTLLLSDSGVKLVNIHAFTGFSGMSNLSIKNLADLGKSLNPKVNRYYLPTP